MKSVWLSIIAFFFPSTQEEKMIEKVTPLSFANKRKTIQVQDVIALSWFTDQQVRAAIHLNKFHNSRHAQKLLSALLSAYLVTLPEASYVILPIPLSKQRMRARGFNQVSVVVQEAIQTNKRFTLNTKALTRIRHTPPQTTLSKKERRTNVSGAFALAPDFIHHIRDVHILLIDDVVTTRSTLCEAKATLLPHKPLSIICIALAH